MAGDMNGEAKWATMFDDMDNKGSSKDGGGDKAAAAPAKAAGGNKRLSVERIYQKKSQLEHVLLRPDTYIGSVESLTQNMWVWDDITERMVQRDLTFVPGLYKIFDEILVNAADNKQRDPKMNTIKIDIDPDNNMVKVWNNGKGIPVVEHKVEKVYVPTLIFGHLLTSSNYNDDEKKVTGGRNGYGAKLCNIFSTKFTVETSCKESKKKFKQSWGNNMGKATDPKISPSTGEDFTCVTFYPDLEKFKMEKLDKDIVDLFTRRAYDIAATTVGCKVIINGKRIPVKNFKDYIDLYIKDKCDDTGAPLKVVHERVNERWEVAITLSEKGFSQVSFANSIATTKGGRHVDYVTDALVGKLIENIKKKEKKSGIVIKPFQVKNHLWVFVNALIVNPTFDSQTKENMTLQAKSFGSKCQISDKFINTMSKCGIVEAVQSWMKFKAQEKLNKKCSNQKQSKLKGVPKLDDANDAGTKNSRDCTLILTEGDSAKTLAVAGLGVVGRDRYGVFPLRGKLLNVREASAKQIMDNAEITNMVKILGLRYKEKYETDDAMKTLRYGKLMIMTDQDQDGSHIKGLLINFIHCNWPNLLKKQFLEEFITPIVKVSKSKDSLSFYSLPEFEEWKKETDNWHTYKVKYYKGLGTSTSKEAKEYFSDMERHRIPFKYAGTEDDSSILLAFSKKKIEERKEWLTNWMDERRRRAQIGLPDLYLYGKETKHITYNEFVNRELILFSNMDNERSIPCLVDGLKPGQRKVLFTCFKRNLVKELKVAQLAGSVAELSAYHHGENSLMSTIIGLAQNYVGSNNINMLQPIGQFGTRLHGGKDAASPRYIFTALSPLARLLMNVLDDALYKYNYDDSQRIEPEWYMPIVPMVLVNGAEGIGTGWSTRIHNYDVRDIVNNLRRMMEEDEPLPMVPSFKNFKGTIERLDETRYVSNGEVSILNDTTIEITELPIRTWTQNYKEGVLEPMLQGTDKVPAFITDYKEYHTDTTVRFVVKMTPEKLAQAEEQGLHKVFKLSSSLSLNTMVLFDASGCIRRYNDPKEILQEFYTLRMDFYHRRKDYLEGMLAAESLKLDNQARFICEKIDGTITIENKPKKEIVQMLVRRGYDSDPVKGWKESQDKLQALQDMDGGDVDDSDSESVSSSAAGSGPDFNYILSMALWCLTKEKKDALLKDRDAKAEQLYQLKKKSPQDLWKDDLNEFVVKLNELEEQEKKESRGEVVVKAKSAKGRAVSKKFAQEATKPSPMGRRVVPRIDEALKAKASKMAAAKKRKAGKKENMDFDDDEDDGVMNKSLSERLGNLDTVTASPELKPKKRGGGAGKPRGPRAKKEPGSVGGTPKKKKRNPWSSEEEEEVVISDFSDMDADGSFSEKVVIPRDTTNRRNAAKKAKYKFSDDESEDGGGDAATDEEDFKPTNFDDDVGYKPKPVASIDDNGYKAESVGNNDDDDSDFDFDSHKAQENNVEKVFGSGSSDVEEIRAPSPVAPTKKYAIFDSDSEQDDYSPVAAPPPTKAAVKEKPPAPKKEAKPKKPREPKPKKAKKLLGKAKLLTLGSDSDPELMIQDNSSDDDLAEPKPKKAAAPKRKKKANSDDSDEEGFLPKKKAAPKKKKAMLSSDDDDDFNLESVAPTAGRAAGGRAKPSVKYTFDDSEEDDDF